MPFCHLKSAGTGILLKRDSVLVEKFSEFCDKIQDVLTKPRGYAIQNALTLLLGKRRFGKLKLNEMIRASMPLVLIAGITGRPYGVWLDKFRLECGLPAMTVTTRHIS